MCREDLTSENKSIVLLATTRIIAHKHCLDTWFKTCSGCPVYNKLLGKKDLLEGKENFEKLVEGVGSSIEQNLISSYLNQQMSHLRIEKSSNANSSLKESNQQSLSSSKNLSNNKILYKNASQSSVKFDNLDQSENIKRQSLAKMNRSKIIKIQKKRNKMLVRIPKNVIDGAMNTSVNNNIGALKNTHNSMGTSFNSNSVIVSSSKASFNNQSSTIIFESSKANLNYNTMGYPDNQRLNQSSFRPAKEIDNQSSTNSKILGEMSFLNNSPQDSSLLEIDDLSSELNDQTQMDSSYVKPRYSRGQIGIGNETNDFLHQIQKNNQLGSWLK